MGRRGRVLTAAAILAAAGMVAALVVARPGAERQGPQLIGGEGSGTVTLEPVLVDPRDPAATDSPSAPDPAIAPSEVVDGAEGGTSESTAASTTGPANGLGVRVGSVGGLFPGHRVKLGVTYVNPYSFPIAIKTVQVDAAGTTRCTGRHLLPATTAPVQVPARSTLGSTIAVGMRRSAPDACQGVRFELRVHVTAVRL